MSKKPSLVLASTIGIAMASDEWKQPPRESKVPIFSVDVLIAAANAEQSQACQTSASVSQEAGAVVGNAAAAVCSDASGSAH